MSARPPGSPRAKVPSCRSGAVPSGFLPGRKIKQNELRLHVGQPSPREGFWVQKPPREARAAALNQEEPQGSAASRTPVQTRPREGTFVPRQFLVLFPPAPTRTVYPGPALDTAPRAVPAVPAPSWHFLLKRFEKRGGGLGSPGGAKGSLPRKEKISKIAGVVQPQVNGSVSPAADRSKGQETTAENKAPRCAPGPARPVATGQFCGAFWTGRRGEVSALLPPPSPFLPGERVGRGKERREEASGAGRRNRAAL